MSQNLIICERKMRSRNSVGDSNVIEESLLIIYCLILLLTTAALHFKQSGDYQTEQFKTQATQIIFLLFPAS